MFSDCRDAGTQVTGEPRSVSPLLCEWRCSSLMAGEESMRARERDLGQTVTFCCGPESLGRGNWPPAPAPRPTETSTQTFSL